MFGSTPQPWVVRQWSHAIDELRDRFVAEGKDYTRGFLDAYSSPLARLWARSVGVVGYLAAIEAWEILKDRPDQHPHKRPSKKKN